MKRAFILILLVGVCFFSFQKKICSASSYEYDFSNFATPTSDWTMIGDWIPTSEGLHGSADLINYPPWGGDVSDESADLLFKNNQHFISNDLFVRFQFKFPSINTVYASSGLEYFDEFGNGFQAQITYDSGVAGRPSTWTMEIDDDLPYPVNGILSLTSIDIELDTLYWVKVAFLDDRIQMDLFDAADSNLLYSLQYLYQGDEVESAPINIVTEDNMVVSKISIEGTPVPVCAGTVGDINGDDKVGLEEAIYALQVSSGLKPVPVSSAPAPVEKTGQTTSYAAGDDGDLRKGVEWISPRFTDNGDGTVTDNMTGLIWLKDANCINSNYPGFDNDVTVGDGNVTWQHALDFVAGINAGTYSNCGGSHTDWRLPNLNELQSLRNMEYRDPCVSNTAGTAKWTEGNVFSGVQSYYYWSSTTLADHTLLSAWAADCGHGNINGRQKIDDAYVWPVRGGN